MKNELSNTIEVWGGVECTINRVGDQYFDQLEFAGHYEREEDLDQLQSLRIKMIRYPVLWERHKKRPDEPIDWSFSERRLNRLRDLGITPVAGLVHHGSGPAYVNFYDGSFETGLAEYAAQVAEKFPWLDHYTPVNEPLTTARFCGLYGHWYPHKKTTHDFLRILVSECKATVMAMKAITKVNPNAKLIQTDDLGKCHSTPLLQYQAHLENERRWTSYELICGTLTPDKFMWGYMLKHGIPEEDLQYFLDNNFPPAICGFNYYKTSERYIDENLSDYPEEFHGGNEFHRYADVHTTLLTRDLDTGPYHLLKEAWQRIGLPLAITECHLYEPRDEQIRWFSSIWKTLCRLQEEGIPVKAITGWALFGLYGWNHLVTQPYGDYEPGIFNLSSGVPRPTALAHFIQQLIDDPEYMHPALIPSDGLINSDTARPIIIIGKNGTLGSAFGRVCAKRRIHHVMVGHDDVDITDYEAVAALIRDMNPWAVVNTAGYVDIDEAERDIEAVYRTNYLGAAHLAEACKANGVRFLTFSSDMVFDGKKAEAYKESDPVSPINRYGESKMLAEAAITRINPKAIIIRSSSFFSPWSDRDFVAQTLDALKHKTSIEVANDVWTSPTYVPDLVIECLNLLFDDDSGIFHIANEGTLTWAEFAKKIADFAGVRLQNVRTLSINEMKRKARRPKFSALTSERGVHLAKLDDALERYFEEAEHNYVTDRIAV